MKAPFKFSLVSVALSATLLIGCGDAQTKITELAPQKNSVADNDHSHSDDITIDSLGRLAIAPNASNQVNVFELDDKTLLDSFSTIHSNSSISASADYRYIVIKNRDAGHIGFIDSGLWQEDHTAHLHDFKQAPAISSYELISSRPTHVVTHEGKMAIFNDGDETSGTNASISVLTDNDIAAQSSTFPSIDLTMNMHGVAEPRGEHLLAAIRRNDNESTSQNKILPDQVAVYHLHNGEYEQEQILPLACPNLHGAAQNKEYVVFGCSDGVLIAHQHDDEYEATKVSNPTILDDMRIGRIIGSEHSETLFAIASQHGVNASKLVSIDPEHSTLQEIDWQPSANAKPLSYGFSYDAQYFTILDNQGYLTLLKPHTHGEHTQWEFSQRIDFTQQDVTAMPEQHSFKIAFSQQSDVAYVSDPIANTIVSITLSDASIETILTLDFKPNHLSWVGIADSHEH